MLLPALVIPDVTTPESKLPAEIARRRWVESMVEKEVKLTCQCSAVFLKDACMVYMNLHEI